MDEAKRGWKEASRCTKRGTNDTSYRDVEERERERERERANERGLNEGERGRDA